MNFKNTIIIMTSNIGSEEFNAEAAKIGFTVSEKDEEKIISGYADIRDRVLKQLPDVFAPEFLNRIDKTIVFSPLDKKVLKSIVILQLDDLIKRLSVLRIQFTYDTKSVMQIVSETYNPEYGARPVRRYIQEKIEDVIADALVDRQTKKHIVLSAEKKALKFIWK